MELKSRGTRAPQKLALMGGVYGNVPALQACIADARRMGCDLFIFPGDATGCCGHSNEALRVIRRHFEVTIQGNHEEEAIAGSMVCACGYGDAEDEQYGCMAHQYAMTSLSDDLRQISSNKNLSRHLALNRPLD